MTSSLEESSKLAQSSPVVAGGPFRIVVSGGVPSMPTSKLWVTGGCSTFRARSMARTLNTWFPGDRSLYSIGDSHCSNGSLSIWHSKSETGSLAVKLKVAVKVPSSDDTTALLIVVWGRVVSSTTVHRHSAGLP